MRTCEEYEEALWEAAETDCVPPALREHCAACTPCREALGDLQQAMRGFTALKTLETLAPRPELSRYLPGPSRRWPWGWGLAATCCLVLIVISILFWHGAPANNVPVVKNPVPAAPLCPRHGNKLPRGSSRRRYGK